MGKLLRAENTRQHTGERSNEYTEYDRTFGLMSTSREYWRSYEPRPFSEEFILYFHVLIKLKVNLSYNRIMQVNYLRNSENSFHFLFPKIVILNLELFK